MSSYFSVKLHILRKKKNANQDDLAKLLGVTRATISDYERGKSYPTFENVIKLSDYFGISIDELVRFNPHPSDNANNPYPIPHPAPHPLPEKQEIAGPYQGISSAMPKVVTVDYAGTDNAVLIPVKAQAGYLSGYGDPEYLATLPAYRFPGLNNGTYRIFEVQGESMHPTIYPGDFAITTYVESLSEIRESHVYVVVSREEGIVIKRVLNRALTENKLILMSDNHKAYPTITITPDQVLEIWYVKAVLSRHLPGPSDVYDRLSDVEGRLILLEDYIKKGKSK